MRALRRQALRTEGRLRLHLRPDGQRLPDVPLPALQGAQELRGTVHQAAQLGRLPRLRLSWYQGTLPNDSRQPRSREHAFRLPERRREQLRSMRPQIVQ